MLEIIHKVLYLTQPLLFCLYFIIVLTPRIHNKKLNAVLFSVFYVFVYAFIGDSDSFVISFLPFLYRYSSLILTLLLVCLVFVLFKDRLRYKLFAFGVFIVGVISSDILSSAIYVLISGNSISQVTKTCSIERVESELIFLVLFAFEMYIFCYLLKKSTIKLGKKSFLLLIYYFVLIN